MDYRFPNNQKPFKLAEILEVLGFNLHEKRERFMIVQRKLVSF